MSFPSNAEVIRPLPDEPEAFWRRPVATVAVMGERASETARTSEP